MSCKGKHRKAYFEKRGFVADPEFNPNMDALDEYEMAFSPIERKIHNQVTNLNARMVSARAQAGISQSELARQLNISPQAVQKYESGKAEPSLDKLYLISDLLHVPMSFLVPDNRNNTDALNERDMRERLLASRLAKLSDEKLRAISIILEIAI